MIFRQSVVLSLFLAAGSGVAFAQARTTAAPVPTNPGITPAPQPVAPNAGAGSSTNQAVPGAGAQNDTTNQANPSRHVSRRQNRAANTRQTTVNQTGVDQTAARRQGDMTQQRRAGTTDNNVVNDHP